MPRYAQQPRSFLEPLEHRMLLSAANDPFSGRAAITSLPATIVDNNLNSSAEPGEPAHAGLPAQRSVWWTWTAPTSGTFHITTAGSDFDTVLAVYTGNTLSTLQPVAADDDTGTAAGYSIVTINASAGTTYQIAVDGYQGAQGTITLNIAVAAPLVINGTAGDDTIVVSSDGPRYVVSINGNQTSYLISSILSLEINGGAGNDRISLTGQVMASTLLGGTGDDTLIGGDGSDLLRGEDGNDEVYAGFGNDTVFGNFGNDAIFGEAGDDSIMAGLGNDSIEGGGGADALFAGDGTDVIGGGDGNDYIEGRGKADQISGGAGDDTIWAGAGNDTVSGDAGDDWIDIGYFSFIDEVDGGDGTDTVQKTVGDGNDVLGTDVENILNV